MFHAKTRSGRIPADGWPQVNPFDGMGAALSLLVSFTVDVGSLQ
jgi:hypothetical protein